MTLILPTDGDIVDLTWGQEVTDTVNDLAAAAAAWSTWVPTVTNITLGSGTHTARYRQVGFTVDFHWKFKLGAGSGVGTDPIFTLPVAAHSSYVASEDFVGNCMLFDASAGVFLGALRLLSSTSVDIFCLSASGSFASYSAVTATVPFTWTTSDALIAIGTYEAATAV